MASKKIPMHFSVNKYNVNLWAEASEHLDNTGVYVGISEFVDLLFSVSCFQCFKPSWHDCG